MTITTQERGIHFFGLSIEFIGLNLSIVTIIAKVLLFVAKFSDSHSIVRLSFPKLSSFRPTNLSESYYELNSKGRCSPTILSNS